MKMQLYLAEHFQWKNFSKTLAEMPDLDVDEIVNDAVVVFLHAEADDPEKAKLETKVVKNIKWLANKRAFTKVVLHSFAHLSSSNAPADFAQPFLAGVAERLTGAGYEVKQTPFGYFCSWQLAVYGESLAKVFKEM